MQIYDLEIQKTKLGFTFDYKPIYLEPGRFDGQLQILKVYIGEEYGCYTTMKLSIYQNSNVIRIENIDTPVSERRKGYADCLLNTLDLIASIINNKLNHLNKIFKYDLEVAYSRDFNEGSIDFNGRVKMFENHGFNIIKDNVMERNIIQWNM